MEEDGEEGEDKYELKEEEEMKNIFMINFKGDRVVLVGEVGEHEYEVGGYII